MKKPFSDGKEPGSRHDASHPPVTFKDLWMLFAFPSQHLMGRSWSPSSTFFPLLSRPNKASARMSPSVPHHMPLSGCPVYCEVFKGEACPQGQPASSPSPREPQTPSCWWSYPAAPTRKALSIRLLCWWPSISPVLQKITRRQINNHKWTVQQASWQVLWHFKHLLNSMRETWMNAKHQGTPTGWRAEPGSTNTRENILPRWKGRQKGSVERYSHWSSQRTWTGIANIIYK